MKQEIKEFCIIVAISYTIISIAAVLVEWILIGSPTPSQANMLAQFVFTTMFVAILYTYKIFDTISPLVLGIIQVIVAECIVMLFTYISSFFGELHPDGYRDMFITTGIPFIIGAIIYYTILHFETKKNNTMIQKIQQRNQHNN